MKMGTMAGAVVVLMMGAMGAIGVASAAAGGQLSDRPLTMAQLEKWIEQYSNWGRWGRDDDLGAINLITPETRKQAAALVRDGISVSLAEEQVPNVEEPGRPAPYKMTLTFRDGYEEQVTTVPWTPLRPSSSRLELTGAQSPGCISAQLLQRPILQWAFL